MEKYILDVIENGLTWATGKPLLEIMIAILVIMALKNWMTNLVQRWFAYQRVAKHPYFKKGCWIRFANSYEYVDGEVVTIDSRQVVVQCAKTFEHIPILMFDGQQKSILKAAPAEIAGS